MDLVQDGFRRSDDAPAEIRACISRIVAGATLSGSIRDERAALELAGGASEDTLRNLIRLAFADAGSWLKDIAYRQAARLSAVPADIAARIRHEIVALAAERKFTESYPATLAHVRRLPGGIRLEDGVRLLRWSHYGDFLALSLAVLLLVGGLVPTLSSSLPWWEQIGWQWPLTAVISTYIILFLPFYFFIDVFGVLRWLSPINDPSKYARGTEFIPVILMHVLWRTMMGFALALVLLVKLERSSIGVSIAQEIAILLGLMWLYSWAPMAWVSMWTGELIERHWWLFGFASPVVAARRNMRHFVAEFINMVRTRWRSLTLVLIAEALAVVWAIRGSDFFGAQLFDAVNLAALSITAAIIVAACGWRAWVRGSAFLSLRGWSSGASVPADVPTLVRVMAGHPEPRDLAKIVREARDKNMVPISAENQQLLERFARAADRVLRQKQPFTGPWWNKRRNVEDVVQSVPPDLASEHVRAVLQVADAEVRDELYLYATQVQKRLEMVEASASRKFVAPIPGPPVVQTVHPTAPRRRSSRAQPGR